MSLMLLFVHINGMFCPVHLECIGEAKHSYGPQIEALMSFLQAWVSHSHVCVLIRKTLVAGS